MDLFLEVDGVKLFQPMYAGFAYVKDAADVTLVEEEVLSTFRYALRPSALFGDVVVLDSLAKDSCLSVNIHFVIVEAHAQYVVEAILFRNSVELIGQMPSIQVDLPLVQIRKDQQPFRLKFLHIVHNVRKAVV